MDGGLEAAGKPVLDVGEGANFSTLLVVASLVSRFFS